MMKKFISNTIMFLFIVLFVKGFEVIFGRANNIVGVTLIISILILMKEDLTKRPLENFLKLLFINIILGFFAHISSQNIWVGLILNFITLSSIGYFFSFNLEKTLIIPFALEYLFMLYAPVNGIDFIKRIIGLIFGAIIVMVIQFIIHRKNKDLKVEDSKIFSFGKEDKHYKEINLFGKTYKIHDVRASYAIRIGLATAISALIVGYLRLEQGKWMIFTIFALTELYSENCKIKSKQRFQGTIIGALLIFVLFIFIKSNEIRGLIVLMAGYLDMYTTNYREKMICITMSVVASASLTNGTLITIAQRVGYVIIGIAIALLFNKFSHQTKVE